MQSWILLLSVCLLLYCLVLRPRRRPGSDVWAEGAHAQPARHIPPDELFGLLLSAKLAVLERDNFDQLASALPARRARHLLQQYWGVASKIDCERIVARRINCLGEACAAEETAYEAWRDGVPIATEEYRALANACWFLVSEGSVIDLSSIRRICSAPLACDIEQSAYLVRLALSVGYLEREQVLPVLRELSARARSRFKGWEDYSLAALIGMAVRTRGDLTDDDEWRHIVRSHRIFLTSQRAAFLEAGDWSGRRAPAMFTETGEAAIAPLNAAAS